MLTPRLFTFQYASIKPSPAQPDIVESTKFTFQYASIKPKTEEAAKLITAEFTFQYASIKPTLEIAIPHTALHLHFNMLLLNPVQA